MAAKEAHVSLRPGSLIVLGTGNSESIAQFNSNALIVGRTGRLLLVDCGYTAKYALNSLGDLELSDIDEIFISHLHGDHAFGLERFAFESRYNYQRRHGLVLEPTLLDPLWNGFLETFVGVSSAGQQQLRDFFDIRLVENHEFRFDGLTLRTFRTNHTSGKDCFGLSVDDRLIWTADTNILPWLNSSNAHTILHDGTSQEGHPAHATIPEIDSSYTTDTKRKIWLIHYDDDLIPGHPVIRDELAGLARFGMQFEI